jgi:YbbR domain-containing protein
VIVAWHPFRHFGLKLLSVLLATGLWMTVTRDQLVERSLRVPVEFRNIPENLEMVGDVPATVDVRVRGPSSILGRLDPGEVVAVVDVRGARPGQRLFHLVSEEVRVPFGIEIAQVNPPTLGLMFERSARRTVPVVPAVEGEPALGFVAGAVRVDPPMVEVVGPISRVTALRQATTESVSIENVRAPVRDTVTIGLADSMLRLSNPRSATVTVDVVPAPIERALRDLPIEVRGLERRQRATTEPRVVTVVVRGGREALGSLDPTRLRPWVDASSLGPGRYRVPVKLDAADDFGVSRIVPSAVEVRVR